MSSPAEPAEGAGPANVSEHDVVPLSPIMHAIAIGASPELRDFWGTRVARHFAESYAGIPMSKFPEDLATYEHLIWERRPDVVLELGVFHGGGSLWFRDRLADLRRYHDGPAPRVVAVDVAISSARDNVMGLGRKAGEGIDFVECDLRSPTAVDALASRIPQGSEVLIVEDAAHDAAVTRAALGGLSHLVQPGGYYVVEDTCVDVEELRGDPTWPRGCGRALDDWLRSAPAGRHFRRRMDLQPYGITCHPGGVLQRVSQ